MIMVSIICINNLVMFVSERPRCMENMNQSGNLTENYTATEDLYIEDILLQYEIESWTLRITIEAVSIISLFCLVVNILACFIIFKFKRLRQNASYKIIVNWFILNSIFMLTSPLLLRVSVDWHILNNIPLELSCFIGQVNAVSLIGSVFLMILLCFQWYFQLYFPSLSSKYDRSIIYFIAAVNMMLIACVVQGATGCITFYYYFVNGLLMMASFLFFNIFMIIMNIVHFCKKKRLVNNSDKNIPYLLTNMFFLLYLSVIIVIILYWVSLGNVFFFMAVCVSSLFTLACPIYFFDVLYKHDRNFNTFTRHVLSCRCTKYTGDEFFDQSVNFNNLQQA